MPCEKKYCANSNEFPKPREKKKFSFLAGLLLALLPKCPFCIMAFTSTAILCGKGTLIESQSTHQSLLTISLSAVCCLIIIASIGMNFRGTRTKYALCFASLGIVLILYSVISGGGQALYYLGVSVVFVAVWLNGSLIWLLRKSKHPTGAENGILARNLRS
jgi:cation transporter-like permease